MPSAFTSACSTISRPSFSSLAKTSHTAAAVCDVFARLEKDGRDIVLQAEVNADGISYARTADLRYVGQGHESSVTLPALDFGADAFVDELFARFEANYAALFGRT